MNEVSNPKGKTSILADRNLTKKCSARIFPKLNFGGRSAGLPASLQLSKFNFVKFHTFHKIFFFSLECTMNSRKK